VYLRKDNTRKINYLLLIMLPYTIVNFLAEAPVPNALKALSDVRSLVLFENVAVSYTPGLRSNDLNRNLRLTSKQLYSRISMLANAGLVKKRSGRYFLTSYGRVIHASLNIINKATLNYHKLVAIDTIETSNVKNAFPEEERKNIIRILIQNKQVRDILLDGDVLGGGATMTDNEPQRRSIQNVTISQ
jgi:DNA-binding HxlR family transcriptional regulator